MESVKIKLENQAVFVRFEGEVTLETTGILKNQLNEIYVSPEWECMIFDMADVSFMDSSGIGFVISTSNRVRHMRREFYLFRPSEHVVKTLQLVNLLSYVQIVEDQADLDMVLPE